MDKTTKFEGWGELFLMGGTGGVRRSGFVTTEMFGDVAMFCVRNQEALSSIRTLEKPELVNGEWLRPGSVVRTVRPRTEFLAPVSVVAFIESKPSFYCAANRPTETAIIYRAVLSDSEVQAEPAQGAV